MGTYILGLAKRVGQNFYLQVQAEICGDLKNIQKNHRGSVSTTDYEVVMTKGKE